LVRVLIQDAAGNTYQEFATDNNAEYSFCDFIQGNYNFYAGRWGFVTGLVTKNINTLADTVTLALTPGYYDDFIMNYGWTVNGVASSGDWEREEPVETEFDNLISNPGADVSNDFGKACFVTGNNGGAAGDDDVDNGYTTLRSPLFDLTTYQNPYLSYYRWFFNDGGQGTAPNDSLTIAITNGTDSVTIENIRATNQPQSQWLFNKIRVGDYIVPTANMRIYFKTMDNTPGHLVEAAIDRFEVVDSVLINSVADAAPVAWKVYPNPFTQTLHIQLPYAPAAGTKAELLNPLGQVVHTEELTQTATMLTLPAALPAGTYLLRLVQSQTTVATVRLVK
jgi:hypothetical protein